MRGERTRRRERARRDERIQRQPAIDLSLYSGGAAAPTIPGFRDLVRIGEGRTSVVYRARAETSGATFALKVSRSREVGATEVDAFARDALRLTNLAGHPNIVPFIESFTTDDGRLVICLELCRGSLVGVLRRKGPVDAPLATGCGVKIAGALESAHTVGLVHNDVTTRNILVRSTGQPALGDFGVARLKSRQQAADGGALPFSSFHVAPEVLEGTTGSAAADVYGLASTIYELCTGAAPFARKPGESTASVALRILRDPPLADTRIPAPLWDVLRTALAKDPTYRPASAAELAARLDSVARAEQWPRTFAHVTRTVAAAP